MTSRYYMIRLVRNGAAWGITYSIVFAGLLNKLLSSHETYTFDRVKVVTP